MPDLLATYLFDFRPLEPTRICDNLYFVGTWSVGAFIIDTGEGLILIDTGWGEADCARFVTDVRNLGLKPENIKLILVSHEHLDHYGGVDYLKTAVCPRARVGMNATGWYHLKTRPLDTGRGPYSCPPKAIDFYLSDCQHLTLGNSTVQIVFTPGHSPGCVSFIIPVTDQGHRHIAGIMGGSALSGANWERAYLYKSSVDYFETFTRAAGCDIGLAAHAWAYVEAMAKLRARKPGEANPLIIGPEKFSTQYLQYYRDVFQNAVKNLPPEPQMAQPPAA